MEGFIQYYCEKDQTNLLPCSGAEQKPEGLFSRLCSFWLDLVNAGFYTACHAVHMTAVRRGGYNRV
jgi:hypothetical protein